MPMTELIDGMIIVFPDGVRENVDSLFYKTFEIQCVIKKDELNNQPRQFDLFGNLKNFWLMRVPFEVIPDKRLKPIPLDWGDGHGTVLTPQIVEEARLYFLDHASTEGSYFATRTELECMVGFVPNLGPASQIKKTTNPTSQGYRQILTVYLDDELLKEFVCSEGKNDQLLITISMDVIADELGDIFNSYSGECFMLVQECSGYVVTGVDLEAVH